MLFLQPFCTAYLYAYVGREMHMEMIFEVYGEPEFTAFATNALVKIWMSVTEKQKNSADQSEQMLRQFN